MRKDFTHSGNTPDVIQFDRNGLLVGLSPIDGTVRSDFPPVMSLIILLFAIRQLLLVTQDNFECMTHLDMNVFSSLWEQMYTVQSNVAMIAPKIGRN